MRIWTKSSIFIYGIEQDIFHAFLKLCLQTPKALQEQ